VESAEKRRVLGILHCESPRSPQCSFNIVSGREALFLFVLVLETGNQAEDEDENDNEEDLPRLCVKRIYFDARLSSTL
jgi:hypothetical protein